MRRNGADLTVVAATPGRCGCTVALSVPARASAPRLWETARAAADQAD